MFKYLTNIAMDGIGIFLLFLIAINFGARVTKRRGLSDKLFSLMVYLNMAVLVADMGMWLLDSQTLPGCHTLLLISTTSYYILQPMLCFSWLIYCEYQLNEDERSLKKHLPVYLSMLVFISALTIVSCFYPLLFEINQANEYSRGILFYPYFVLTITYLVYSYVLIFKTMRADTFGLHPVSKILLIYPLFPAFGAIFQMLYFGIALIWLFSVFALLILYFNLQNQQGTTDPLTQISNRRRFQTYLINRLANRRGNTMLYVLIIDVNRFKVINDTYGHLAGDEALKTIAKLLTQNCRSTDFVARFGGDEFVITGEVTQKRDVEALVQRIQICMDAYNQNSSNQFELSLSIGTAVVNPGEEMTIDELLSAADREMYIEKEKSHARDDARIQAEQNK